MDIIKTSIEKPVAITVAVILVVMFGLIGLNKLPVQLTPDVETPKITVNTTWPGATPYEIEKEIIEKQEEALKGLRGLTELESASFNSYGEISLSFELDTDLDAALLRVSNKMNEVSNYPENSNQPVIEAAGASSSPVIWMMLKTKPENSHHINEFKTFFENNIRQHLERVKGVGSLFVFGGTENELHITLDAEKMARNNITINQVIGSVRKANTTISAGVLGIAKKNYRIRTVSQFQSPTEALDVVIFDDGTKRVYLHDVARVDNGFKKEDVAVEQNGTQVIVIGVRKEQGANVLAMTEQIESKVTQLNEGLLAKNDLYIDWVYDQRPYINTAIDLVKQNVLVGSILAICVLLIFLRSIRSTLTTAIAIPISAIGTFIFLWIMGRNLNVVSLAGISFAVGMLVDNSIVVLENIDRHRKMGKSAMTAAHDGATEVWGAVLASTATTVAVFLPVIFMQEEAGQLFRDIAIAITFSIILSLFVSVSVIPSLFHLFYRNQKSPTQEAKQTQTGAFFSMIGTFFVAKLMTLSDFCLKTNRSRTFIVVLFTSLSIALTWLLMPPAEYLPQGNRNLILNILIPPPGYSVDKMKEIGGYVYNEVEPYLKEDGKDGIPQIKDIFYVASDRMTLFGGLSAYETRAKEMMPLFNRIMHSIPGVFGVSIQAGIFESDIGEGNNIDINVSGVSIEAMINASRTLFGTVSQKIPGAQVRPVPSLETSYPEVRIIPNKEKLAANGLSEEDLGIYIDILMDGRKIDEYRPEGIKQVDLLIKGNDTIFTTPEAIIKSTIVNSFGQLIRVGDVADLVYTEGMPQINHRERLRTITLQVTPPPGLPLQTAMETVQNEVIAGLQNAGALDGVTVTVGGNADKLTETRQALQWNLLLALLITYLLMAALFENFLYPLIILFSVPLAAAGGFVGLRLVDIFIAPQGFDVLAMLGFIILIGTVVNNAILIVHQSLNNVRYNNLQGVAAISDAVQTRIRPIFMSATTSVLGMLPLVLSTGSGSELYRGLGSILLGGLAMSTLFTLFVIPALLAFVIGMERSRHETL
ncbi:MAG: efflux RND transporter permease subunit [Proteobacteria bacterium]|nr:efflux RND transporter permease subunit [Pseudomonadota bacterium]MBU1640382.1 efflux RND transporter permease subunit [Pseudomonadota bacterium]